MLDSIRITDLRPHATDAERRTLLDELAEHVEVHEEHLTVRRQGAPPLRVAFHEVGLKHSGLRRVRGSTRLKPEWRLGCPLPPESGRDLTQQTSNLGADT